MTKVTSCLCTPVPTAHPMPYWSEVMTGFEYTYALGLVKPARRHMVKGS